MNTLPEHCLDPPRPLIAVSLVQGPDFQWPSSDPNKITSCPALSFVKALDAASIQLNKPIRTITIGKNSSLPPRKHTRDSSETRKWHEPQGIFKSTWYKKHTLELPSVVVCPVNFNPLTDDQQWEKHESEIQKIYAQAKSQLNGRHCRLVMLCVCAREYSVDQETKDRLHTAHDRITSLRKHLGVEKSQVQLLYAADMTPTSISLLKVNKALHGYAADYYKVASKLTRDHKRGVDARSGLSFCAQLIMNARHNLKTAVFYEFRGTPAKAMRHLDVSFGKLVDLAKVYKNDMFATGKSTKITVEELKSIASVVNYSICRLKIAGSKPLEAAAQFQRFISVFRHLKSEPPLVSLSSGTVPHPVLTLYLTKQWKWLAAQHEIFSALLAHAKMNNISLIQPELMKYFQKGNNKTAKANAANAVSANKTPTSLMECTYLSNAVFAHRKRHRLTENLKNSIGAWGGVAVDEEDRSRLQKGLYIGGMLTYDNVAPSVCTPVEEDQDHGFEQVHRTMIHATLEGILTDTNAHVLDLIKKVMGLMRQELNIGNDTRESRRSLTMGIIAAEWLIKVERYEDALNLLKPAMQMLRKERWSTLLVKSLSLAKYCSIRLHQSNESLLYGLELIGNPSCLHKSAIQKELIDSPSSTPSTPSTSSIAPTSSVSPTTSSTSILNMDISTSPIRLINVQVTFQRNVVQINDSVQISLTLSSNFPEPVELNYVVLRLEQLKLERRASISTPTPTPPPTNTTNTTTAAAATTTATTTTAEGKKDDVLSYICLVVKTGVDVASLIQRICGSNGRIPDAVITQDVISISPKTNLSFDLNVVMKVPLPTDSSIASIMPKHGTVIFPTYVTTGISCLENRQVDLNIDLDSVRSADVADALSRVDAYATKTSMLSLLRPTVDGRNNGTGSFRFTRLIPPLSSVDVQIKHDSHASYNDWHPVELNICMLDNMDSSADDLELTLWFSNPSSGEGEGERSSEIQIMDQSTTKWKSYDPKSDPVIKLGSLSAGKSIVISACVRFNRFGLPNAVESHVLNVSVFHRTSSGWPATKHGASNISVASPFTVALATFPTTRVKGHLSVSPLATSIVVGEALLVSSLVTCKVENKPIHVHNIAYVPNYDMNKGTLSEIVSSTTIAAVTAAVSNTKEKKTTNSQEIETISLLAIINKSEELAKSFIIRPLVAASSQTDTSLGTVNIEWSTPSILKHDSLVMNKTSLSLPFVKVDDVQAVTAYVVAPTKCHLGEGFEMILVVENRGKTVVPITFIVSLGSDFYCAGRTTGGHTVQPLSTSRTNFRLIGVKSGNVSLPGIVAEREGGEKFMVTDHTGKIMCFP